MGGFYFEKVEIKQHDITYLEVDSNENTSKANGRKPQADDRQSPSSGVATPGCRS